MSTAGPTTLRPVLVSRDRAAVRAVIAADGSRAQLAPIEGHRVTTRVIRECLERVSGQGVSVALTPALMPNETEPWLRAGFEPTSRLMLLRLDLSQPRARRRPGPVRLRRCGRRDWPALDALDRRAFGEGWHLDASALAEAADATPMSRVRVAGDLPLGYAITGLAGARGFLQRLAVDPAQQGRGIAGALLGDAVQWLDRHGATELFVNTEPDNERAIELYTRFGFVPEPDELLVLTWTA